MSLLSLIVYSKVRLFPVVFSFEVNILLYRLNDFNVHLSAQMIILTGVACAVAVVMFCLKVKFPPMSCIFDYRPTQFRHGPPH